MLGRTAASLVYMTLRLTCSLTLDTCSGPACWGLQRGNVGGHGPTWHPECIALTETMDPMQAVPRSSASCAMETLSWKRS